MASRLVSFSYGALAALLSPGCVEQADRSAGGTGGIMSGGGTVAQTGGATPDDGSGDQGAAAGGGDQDGAGPTAEATGATVGTTGLGDGGGDDGASSTGLEACASVSEVADNQVLPADIVFIVDNSGSMSAEAGFVQDNLNQFSTQISMSGVDHHVVLISSYPDDGNGICVDAPLGSGGCANADTNLPQFLHVDERVGSHDALQLLVQTHDQWSASIRPESVKHIVIVSDDESDMTVAQFDAAWLALDPSYDPYVVHSIVCPWDCPSAAGIGQVYLDLTDQTGGVLGDLCLQDFQPVFDALATAVIDGVPVSCSWDIPAPPPPYTLDPEQVNVEIEDGLGGVTLVAAVEGPADCAAAGDGWYYDDPIDPVQIILCPQTCTTVQSYEMGAVSVQFGCETIVPG